MNAKRIFITGGASGLARALAERHGRAGYRVCIGDINKKRGAETLSALRGLSVEAHFIDCDVTSEKDLQAAAKWLQAEWGGVDIVVNNAGVAMAGGIDEQSLADWQWAVNINCWAWCAVARCSRLCSDARAVVISSTSRRWPG
ncbi:MAG TPA: SDR family NAD(P)-dependent oxidoreductase [Edaphobacter sp.]|uniref:SDR family NAD(P)-dependent oxidoreductase n=1 Tax=Edaphobacter sp. TaxID=1934404 RepID=UPI002C0E12F9|nr:SDR family NAD(P)-dependent oxidoreductase [Edaphobacter sp.]HUZ97621.1 SDR family NAD(P)-dependent oxidoreductase [Edaphobacter sp.]